MHNFNERTTRQYYKKPQKLKKFSTSNLREKLNFSPNLSNNPSIAYQVGKGNTNTTVGGGCTY